MRGEEQRAGSREIQAIRGLRPPLLSVSLDKFFSLAELQAPPWENERSPEITLQL